MLTRMSMNAMIAAIVLAFALICPMAAHAVCIDECAPAPLPTATHGGAGAHATSTGTLQWNFKSSYPFKVAIKFYSETRHGHEWPSVKEMWVLDDSASHSFRLGCVSGEKICYGAWPTSNEPRHWGKGHGNKFGCPDCCHICGDGTREVNLVR